MFVDLQSPDLLVKCLPVGITRFPEDMGMGFAENNIEDLRVLGDYPGHGIEHGFKPLAGAQQAKGEEDLSVFNAQFPTKGIRSFKGNIRDAMRDERDFLSSIP